jgi:hypothetical protein
MDYERDTIPGASGARWWTIVLRDVHFWVPVAVLAGGLIVLSWIS